MALGLIQFLIGGKKNKKSSKSAQVGVSVSKTTSNANTNETQVPDGVSTPTQNVKEGSQETSHSSGAKKSVSEALIKIHKELQESNERLTGLVTDVKGLDNSVNSLTHRVDEIDKKNSAVDEKFQDIDSSMSKFLSLYELINNQYNPFVSSDGVQISQGALPEVEELIEAKGDNGNGLELEHSNNEDKETKEKSNFTEEPSFFEMKNGDKTHSKLEEATKDVQKNMKSNTVKKIVLPQEKLKISESLLELDTLDIEEAAADCVPLVKLKNNTNGLVIILSWLEYLIKTVGVEEARNTLRYYTETLRWLTPEVFFDLDKYLRGMNDTDNVQRSQANVRDHIVSLYFISKLNEKSLDRRLTKAVLEIIQG